jgi:hypothetical protein
MEDTHLVQGSRRYTTPGLDFGGAEKKLKGVATSAFIQPVINGLSAPGSLSVLISIKSQKDRPPSPQD